MSFGLCCLTKWLTTLGPLQCLLILLVVLFFVLLRLRSTFTSPYPRIVIHSTERYYLDPLTNEQHPLPQIGTLLMSKNSVTYADLLPATLYLSVIVPAYNEEKRLPTMMREALDHLEGRKIKYELIVVDDASTDSTTDVALGFARQYGVDKVRVITLAVNRGKGGAIRMGVLAARGEVILFAGEFTLKARIVNIVLPSLQTLMEQQPLTIWPNWKRNWVQSVLARHHHQPIPTPNSMPAHTHWPLVLGPIWSRSRLRSVPWCAPFWCVASTPAFGCSLCARFAILSVASSWCTAPPPTCSSPICTWSGGRSMWSFCCWPSISSCPLLRCPFAGSRWTGASWCLSSRGFKWAWMLCWFGCATRSVCTNILHNLLTRCKHWEDPGRSSEEWYFFCLFLCWILNTKLDEQSRRHDWIAWKSMQKSNKNQFFL